MEEASIDLRNNPLVNRFFLGWSTQKAVTFAENLLVIGIGVAKKLLNNNTPEDAYHKLLKMSENVMKEYNLDNPMDAVNQVKQDSNMQGQNFSEREGARSRKKQFRNNQQQESFDFEESYSSQTAAGALAERKKVILSQEISKVKQKLELINQKLNSQPLWEKVGNQFQQNNYAHHQLNDQESNQLMSPSMSRGRQRQSRLNSPVTPKITSSPPPAKLGNVNITSLANSRSHLNDEGIKQCMNIDSRENEGEFFGGLTSQSKVFSEMKNQYQPEYYKDNFMYTQPSKEKISARQQPNQKFNTEGFHREVDIAQKSNPSKLQKKKQYPYQQSYQSESNIKKNPHYMHVESRIKNEIKVSRGQHQQNTGKQGENSKEESQDDFKQMMIKGQKEQAQKTKQKMEASKQQTKQQQQQSDIAMEMGVQFSRDAQKKFYEKQELERQKQEKQRELAELKKQQAPVQLQTYQIHYNAAQQQQFFKNLDAIGQYNFNSDQQLGSQHESNIEPSRQAIPSMQTTLQGNSQGRQNLLDIENSFLQSPFMNQLNDVNNQNRWMMMPSYGEIQSADKNNSQCYPYTLANPMSDVQAVVSYPLPSQSASQEQFYGKNDLLEVPPSGFSLGGFTQSFNPEQTQGGQQFKDRNLSNVASNKQYQLNTQNFMRNGEDNDRKGERLVQRDRLTGQEIQQNYDETTGKYEDFFRESISNSDFTLPNEEIQQFFKNQIFNPK